jgi:hypothetical protein
VLNRRKDVDARDKHGHDSGELNAARGKNP